MMLKTMEMKSIEPKLTQKLIGKQIGFTVSTDKRLKQFLNVDSHYNRSEYKKKKNQTIQKLKPTPKKRTEIINKKNNEIIKKND